MCVKYWSLNLNWINVCVEVACFDCSLLAKRAHIKIQTNTQTILTSRWFDSRLASSAIPVSERKKKLQKQQERIEILIYSETNDRSPYFRRLSNRILFAHIQMYPRLGPKYDEYEKKTTTTTC